MLIDRKNWPDDMRRAFNAELTVHIAATVLSVLVIWCVSGLATAALWPSLPGGFAVLIILLLPILQMIIRMLLRDIIRSHFGRGPDRAPWWFNLSYVRATPDLARDTLNDWQLRSGRTYLPGIEYCYGVFWSYCLAALALSWALPPFMMILVICKSLFCLSITLIPTFRATTIRRYTLPADGKPATFWFFPARWY